jgi:hypothetical protein
VVAEYDPETGETWLADNHWGQTTGRHLGYCRRKLPRIRSNDPSALDGIGPNCVVRELEDPGPAVGRRTGRVIETHPLAGAIRVRFDGWPGTCCGRSFRRWASARRGKASADRVEPGGSALRACAHADPRSPSSRCAARLGPPRTRPPFFAGASKKGDPLRPQPYGALDGRDNM